MAARTYPVSNDLINPRGRNAHSGWTCSLQSATPLTFAEVTDPDIGGCLEIVADPTAANDWLTIALDNAGTKVACRHRQMVYMRYWVKLTSGSGVTVTTAVHFYNAGVLVNSSNVLSVGKPATGQATEVEAWDNPENATVNQAVPAIYFNPDSGNPFTVRVKAQMVVNPWGDVPAYCDGTEPGCTWSGTADASRSTGTVRAELPAIYGFNDLTYSAFDVGGGVTPVEEQAIPTATNIAMNRSVGANAIRSWSGWAKRDENAAVDFYVRRQWMLAMRAAGIRFCASVDAPPTWMTTDGLYALDEGDFDEIAGWVAQLVEEFGDIICAVQVGNEYNFGSVYTDGILSIDPDPAKYATYLNAYYEAVKAVDPDMPVITTSINGTGSNNSTSGTFRYQNAATFLDGILDAGAQMDGVSLHPYPSRATSGAGTSRYGMWGAVSAVLDVLDAHSLPTMPLWITEVGWVPAQGDGTPTGRAAEILQAQFVALARGALNRHPRIDAVFLHTLWETSYAEYGAFSYPSQRPKPVAQVLAA